MPVRLLIACGMLAVACPVSAQIHYYGHGTPVYGSHHDVGHRGQAHPHTYSGGYHSWHAPLVCQYDMFQHDAGHQAFRRGGFDRWYGTTTSNFDSCPGASACPRQRGYAHAGSPQQYEQYGDRQYGSSQSHHGHDPGHAHQHGHDYSHSHASPTPLTPRGDVGRLRELPRNRVPFRDQVAPGMQAPVPSDRQPLAPPSLPPSSLSRPSRPEQFETPLGDGPPPNTVPLSSPFRSPDQVARPTTLNI